MLTVLADKLLIIPSPANTVAVDTCVSPEILLAKMVVADISPTEMVPVRIVEVDTCPTAIYAVLKELALIVPIT